MITLGKKGDLHSRRQAHSFLRTDDAVKRLFDVVAPRYGDRNGGYLRIVRTGFQQGDGAEKAFIELLGAEKQLEVKRQKRADLKAKKRDELEKQLEAHPKWEMPAFVFWSDLRGGLRSCGRGSLWTSYVHCGPERGESARGPQI